MSRELVSYPHQLLLLTDLGSVTAASPCVQLSPCHTLINPFQGNILDVDHRLVSDEAAALLWDEVSSAVDPNAPRRGGCRWGLRFPRGVPLLLEGCHPPARSSVRVLLLRSGFDKTLRFHYSTHKMGLSTDFEPRQYYQKKIPRKVERV